MSMMGTMYSLKYDQQFVFLNMITDEFLNPKEMIEIIKNFNPGEEVTILDFLSYLKKLES